MNKIDTTSQKITQICRFITGKLNQSGLSGYVLGLSGGIDSAVSLALAVKAIGPEKVLGVMLPYKSSSKESLIDAQRMVDLLKIESRTIEISQMIDSYFGEITNGLKIRAGNKMARERMSILFDISQETGRMVLGTGNRTEICLGYTTWYGDSACSINPLGELYKNEIREMAIELNIPQEIIDKAPSADLWEGQTDEHEIGVTYENIDGLLKLIIDQGINSMAKLIEAGFDQSDISQVISLINRNSYKRRMPHIAPLGKTEIPENVFIQE